MSMHARVGVGLPPVGEQRSGASPYVDQWRHQWRSGGRSHSCHPGTYSPTISPHSSTQSQTPVPGRRARTAEQASTTRSRRTKQKSSVPCMAIVHRDPHAYQSSSNATFCVCTNHPGRPASIYQGRTTFPLKHSCCWYPTRGHSSCTPGVAYTLACRGSKLL